MTSLAQRLLRRAWRRRRGGAPKDGSITPDTPARSEPVVNIGEDGRRSVSWSWRTPEGTNVFEHDLPDALEHHYAPAAANEEVALYRGTFWLGDGRAFDGEVRYRWFPTPGVNARGSSETTTADVVELFAHKERSLWVDPTMIDIDLIGGALPPQPRAIVPPAASARGHSIDERIEQQLGSPNELERVTFLVPNGWPGDAGHGICDPGDLQRVWRGRTEANGDGWKVTLDRHRDMDLQAWRELKHAGGYRFTHIGCLERGDGAPFTGREAFDALDRVRAGLNVALGRRTTCCLPVGWRAGRPVWTRWRSAPVDPYATRSHWLDETVASAQVSGIVSRVLAFTSDPVRWQALRPAIAYYMAANVDVDVELSVSIPVSALQLLAYYKFVTELGQYSNAKWHDLDTEPQLRLLLSHIGADLDVRPHFAYLTAVRDRLAPTAPARDALGVVVKMRNVVTHPTRDKPARFSIYEWGEAGMHVRYWLCLALLNTVGYNGQIADVLGPTTRWSGQIRAVPWSPSPP